MSSYDENGNGANWVTTAAGAGLECELCGQTIDRVQGGNLYNYDGELFCFPCLFNEIFGKYKTTGYCDSCTAGFDAETIRKSFTPCDVYPVGGRALCPDCIINELLDGIINEDDPAEL